MKCHACGADYADTASFCPFCGTRPKVAAPAATAESEADEERTVALDVGALDQGSPADPSGPAQDDGESEATVAFDGSQFQQLDEPSEQTVAMAVPPEFAADPSGQRPKTMMGHPGMLVGKAPAQQVDPMGPTMEATALSAEELERLRSYRTAPKDSAAVEPVVSVDVSLGRSASGAAQRAERPGQSQALAASDEAAAAAPRGKSRLPVVAVVVVLLLAAAGVVIYLGGDSGLAGGGGAGAAAGAVDASDVDLPQNVDAVARVDVAALRDSWLYARLEGKLMPALEADGDYRDLNTSTGIGPKSLNELRGAIRGTKAEPQFALLGDGTFDVDKVTAFLDAELGKSERGGTQEVAGVKLFVAEEGILVGLASDELALAGTSDMVTEIMAVGAGAPSYRKNEALEDIADEVGASSATVWVAAVLTEEMATLLAGMGPDLKGLLGKGDALAVSVAVGDDIVMEAAVQTTDARGAEKLEQRIQGSLDMARSALDGEGDMPVELRDAGLAVLKTVALERDGQLVTFAVTIPRKVAELVLSVVLEELDPPGR